ncbi:hypothetical protein HDU80_001579 [Chytriomyces hyalinus]|nr:hypothetical protein HDU80_001579 [Chytriomyces hyalinus]
MRRFLFTSFATASAVSATPLFQVRRDHPANALVSRQFADNSSMFLVYYGGPVLTKVEVQPIFYGAFAEETKSTLSSFYSFLTNSEYTDFIADEWSVTGQKIEHGSVLPSITYSGALVGSLDDATYTKQLLRNMIKAGTIKPNSNSYYPIYLGPGVNATQGSHHEFAEAVTNPAIGVAKSLGSPLSWYLMGYGETGDILTHTHEKTSAHTGNTIQETMTDTVTGKTWVVQKLWSNKYQMCMSQSPSNKAAKIAPSSDTAVTTSKSPINSAVTSKSSSSVNAAPKPAISKPAYVKTTKAAKTTKKSTTTKKTTTKKAAVKTTTKKKHLIFYGKVPYQKELAQFYTYITRSPVMDLLSQYSAKNYKIGYGKYMSSRVEPGPFSNVIDDTADIHPYLINLITTKSIIPTANTYYVIYYGQGIKVTQSGALSCETMCSYHSTLDISKIPNKNNQTQLYYGIVPYQGDDCDGVCGPSYSLFENMCAASSHELTETITNPSIGLARRFAPPLSWYDPLQGEVADMCNQDQVTMKDAANNNSRWVVQKLWSNLDAKCMNPSDFSFPVTSTTTTGKVASSLATTRAVALKNTSSTSTSQTTSTSKTTSSTTSKTTSTTSSTSKTTSTSSTTSTTTSKTTSTTSRTSKTTSTSTSKTTSTTTVTNTMSKTNSTTTTTIPSTPVIAIAVVAPLKSNSTTFKASTTLAQLTTTTPPTKPVTTAITPAAAVPSSLEYYTITIATKPYILIPSKMQFSSGTKLTVTPSTSTNNPTVAKFRLDPFIGIVSLQQNSSLCIGVVGGKVINGAELGLVSCKEDSVVGWNRMELAWNVKGTTLCMDLFRQDVGEGAGVGLWVCKGTGPDAWNQAWSFGG